MSPDGQQIWVANQGDNNITIVDADSLEVFNTITGIATNHIVFLPDGTAVIPGGVSADNSLRYVTFFDGESQDVTRKLELPGSTNFVTGIRMLAANELLFLTDSALDTISVSNLATASPPDRIVINADNVDGMVALAGESFSGIETQDTLAFLI